MNCCRAILEMIGELHTRGFEAIRFCPQISNSGVHWIAWLTSAERVLPKHGAILHRLRQLVQTTQDVSYAVQNGVPRSTAHGWLNAPRVDVVTLDSLDMEVHQLQREVLRLRSRIRKLIALLRVLLVVLRISQFSLNQVRLPDRRQRP